ncbi:50S ribosomal protein L30 [Metallosphaera tengchongensis]|uniref:Large ribosomal subunit protein uL30 n=1 Tax=Metallosphaera tengchongensis TaxID=1532350 RepID=A0A6N0NTB7_9CREN|nr:50S ribosomal protein L30 [Metallosphaera tengchongensis]QKQ99941.1 50S ribosomal protein L30 [Metallosphaera tengchongensis]
MSSLLVIRIRGSASAPWNIQEVLKMLRLENQYNAIVFPKDESIIGSLRKVQSYVTWGELNMDGAKALLYRMETYRGKLDEKILRESLNISLEEFTKNMVEGKIKLSDIDVLKLPIRLHPPRKGFKGKINAFLGSGGELGYRGEAINELVRRMV